MGAVCVVQKRERTFGHSRASRAARSLPGSAHLLLRGWRVAVVVGRVLAADRRGAADNARRVPCRDGAVEHAAAALPAELDPPVVAAALSRPAADVEAAQLPLLVAKRAYVVAEALEAAVAGPAPEGLLVRIQLVLRRRTLAVINGLVLNVAH